MHEHFIFLQKELINRHKLLGESKKAIPKKLEVIFIYLRAQIENKSINLTTHDIKNICEILFDSEATYVLTDSFKKSSKHITLENLNDSLDKAIDVMRNKKDKEKPEKLIDRAISAIEYINRNNKYFTRNIELITMVDSLSDSVKELKLELSINN